MKVLFTAYFYRFETVFSSRIEKLLRFNKNDLSKLPPHADLKSKKFIEKTFGPVFLCEKVLKNKIQTSV
jgi:hypothetical protein